MSQRSLSMKCTRHFYLILSLLGLSFFTLATIGTNDTYNFYRYAHSIEEHGMLWMYQNDEMPNHPPLSMLLMWISFKLSGSSLYLFACLYRSTQILAAILLGWKVLSIASSAFPRVLLILFSPVFILISAVHCNSDTLVCAFVIASVLTATQQNQFFISGILFALSINIKLIPIIFIPSFLFALRGKKLKIWLCGFIFCMTMSALAFLPLVGFDFVEPVFAYKSMVNLWGIPAILMTLQDGTNGYLTDFYSKYGSIFILTICTFIALKKARSDLITSLSLQSIAFVVLASGWGVQYLIYPFLGLFFLRDRLSIAVLVLLNIFVITFYAYFASSEFPILFMVDEYVPTISRWVGLIAWSMMLVMLYNHCLRDGVTASKY